MYVCVCNAITEREVKRAIADGAATVGQLKDKLQVATSCGSCADYVEHCLNEALSKEISFPALVSI